MRRDRAWVILDLLLQQIDRSLQLGVAARERRVRQVVDNNVRIDTVAFNQPLLSVAAIQGSAHETEEIVRERERIQ